MAVREPHISGVSVEKVDQSSGLILRQTIDIANIGAVEEEDGFVRLRMTGNERVHLCFEGRVVARDDHVAHAAVNGLHPT